MAGIGEQLRTAREAKGLSLSQAAGGTRIKIQHLESIERDDFSNIAAAAYARGFIKIYAEFLGLEPEPLLRIYMEQHAPIELRPSLSGEEVIQRPRSTPERSAGENTVAEPGQEDAEPRPPTRTPRRLSLDQVNPTVLYVVAGGLAVVLVLAFWIGRSGRSRPAPLGAGAPLVIQEPPDPYLAVAAPEESAP